MSKLNTTLCDIHFLVLNNEGNSDKNIFTNKPKSELELSWIQKLYLDKALHLYKKKNSNNKEGRLYFLETQIYKKKVF